MILLGADQLSRFLNRAAETPFVWGSHDCLLWLADWVALRYVVDPGSTWRGRYSTMREAARIVRDAGGMVSLLDGAATLAGLPRVKCGARGDVAVVAVDQSVATDGGEHFGDQAGAILLDGSAALISQGGLVVAPMPVVAAWRVG